jgi:hypothetical protein
MTHEIRAAVTALRSVYAPRFLDFLPKRLGAVMRGRMERCFERHPNRTRRPQTEAPCHRQTRSGPWGGYRAPELRRYKRQLPSESRRR